MKIKVTQEVSVPLSPYCGNCIRRETDKNGYQYCALLNRFVFLHKGHFVKCRECYNALYEAVTSEGTE